MFPKRMEKLIAKICDDRGKKENIYGPKHTSNGAVQNIMSNKVSAAVYKYEPVTVQTSLSLISILSDEAAGSQIKSAFIQFQRVLHVFCKSVHSL
jgi:hypothetical protein